MDGYENIKDVSVGIEEKQQEKEKAKKVSKEAEKLTGTGRSKEGGWGYRLAEEAR